MRSSSRTRVWLALGTALLGGLVALVVLSAQPRHRPRAASPADAPAAAAPYRARLAYPSIASTPEPAPPPAAQPAAPEPAAPAASAPAPRTIPDDHGGPPAPKQTATAWIGSYKDSVCACQTRTCVRELQAAFVHALGGMSYDEERDGAAYAEASRAAIRCYANLPVKS